MDHLIDYFPVTPNGEYRRMVLPNHGFCNAELVKELCEELERRHVEIRSSGDESSAAEKFAAWVLSGTVRDR